MHPTVNAYDPEPLEPITPGFGRLTRGRTVHKSKEFRKNPARDALLQCAYIPKVRKSFSFAAHGAPMG